MFVREDDDNLPFKGKGESANGPLDLIHSDVCGPMSTHAKGGFFYFITVIDDHSRYGYLYLMRYKSEAFEKFKKFINEVGKQLGGSIKTLRSDRGGEYLSKRLSVCFRIALPLVVQFPFFQVISFSLVSVLNLYYRPLSGQGKF